MLKVFVGVVRFRDEREFVIGVDGESQPIEDAVKEIIYESWGEGSIETLTEGVDFIEFIHSSNKDKARADGYILQVEVSSQKRVGFAVQYARRLRNLEPDAGEAASQ
jgi:hypothetical protein